MQDSSFVSLLFFFFLKSTLHDKYITPISCRMPSIRNNSSEYTFLRLGISSSCD